MSVFQFYELTPLEFQCALADHEKELEYNQRFQLEKMRLQTVFLINSERKKQNQFSDPKKLMIFDWEKPEVEPIKEYTEEDWKELDRKANEFELKMQQKK